MSLEMLDKPRKFAGSIFSEQVSISISVVTNIVTITVIIIVTITYIIGVRKCYIKSSET